MSNDAKPATLVAVQCVACKTLHPVDSTRYMVLTGQIRYRETYRGHINEKTQSLGTTEAPIVLCSNSSCLLQHINSNGELLH